jgi:hypothetical protein
VLTLIVDEENPPEWIKGAQTRSFAQKGALTLANIAPGYLEDISSLSEKLKNEQEKIAAEAEEAAPSEDSTGYSQQQRQLLENIMDAGEAGKDAVAPLRNGR